METSTPTIVRFTIYLVINLILFVGITYIVFFAHATGINSLLIPNELRYQHGVLRQDLTAWKIIALLIDGIELIGLLWLTYRFNQWYSQRWLSSQPTQTAQWMTGLTGLLSAITIIYFFR